ncbi:MAG: 5'-nucleotidase [Clostridiales bacterium GWB2_37_7]|nr:MAG: 5'-nucleotidase [Clostridiales bacterium GWB2_37_7]
MSLNLEDKVVIAVSSRALFDLDDSHAIYQQKGLKEFIEYQVTHENEALKPGVAFPLIKRLVNIRMPGSKESCFEVILVSQNNPNTGLRVFNSIEAYELDITRAAFTGGRVPYRYLKAFKSSLFLSAESEHVRVALQNGHAAATILKGVDYKDDDTNELRIAFDGDAVLFNDESERIYQEKGIEEFIRNEIANCDNPLGPGPFKNFLESIHKIQQAFMNEEHKPIRTALVTARNAPSHKRAIKTLRSWGIDVDEAFFLGGLDKTPVLDIFKPHIFFDDSRSYCEPASSIVPTGHVDSGVKNIP